MTGNGTVRSIWKYGVALIVLLSLASIILAGPAEAHQRQNYAKQRRHVKERAVTMRGTPYRYGGTSPNGFDCSGFTQWTYEGHGARLPHSSIDQFNLARRDGYKRIWHRSKLEVGDLVFHKTTSARVGHVGIYVGNGKFISATSSGGVQIRSIWDPYYWGQRWVGATRLPATIRYKG